MDPKLKFLRLDHGADLPVPAYASAGAAGLDIQSAERFHLRNGETVVLKTGFAVEVPAGYELQVRSRSGLAAKHGLFVTNGIGTIDEDYRGEIMVILSHLGKKPYTIERGDRIAQLVLCPITRADACEVTALSSTERGTGGLGSTGR